MTLERRRKPQPREVDGDSDANAKKKVRQSGEDARRDTSQRAAELLARLRKL